MIIAQSARLTRLFRTKGNASLTQIVVSNWITEETNKNHREKKNGIEYRNNHIADAYDDRDVYCFRQSLVRFILCQFVSYVLYSSPYVYELHNEIVLNKILVSSGLPN